jgi:hypothetical protein
MPDYHFEKYFNNRGERKSPKPLDIEIVKWLLKSNVGIQKIMYFSSLRLNYKEIKKIRDEL